MGRKLSNDELCELLKSKEKLKAIPIIINFDFGHTRPLVTLPIGCQCKIVNERVTIIQ